MPRRGLVDEMSAYTGRHRVGLFGLAVPPAKDPELVDGVVDKGLQSDIQNRRDKDWNTGELHQQGPVINQWKQSHW